MCHIIVHNTFYDNDLLIFVTHGVFTNQKQVYFIWLVNWQYNVNLVAISDKLVLSKISDILE